MTPLADGRALPRLAVGLAAAGLALAWLALIDPRWLAFSWLSVCSCGAAYACERRPARRGVLHAMASLTAAWLLAALVGPSFAADSPGYYAFARSLLFDGDIDFFNEWARWGFEPRPTSPTGLMMSPYSTGPALLWAPFVLASHLYVLVAGAFVPGALGADGYSLPYIRATAAGTVAYATAACWLLAATLSRRVGGLAWIAVLGAVATSPVWFYLFLHSGMSHGLAFALSAALVWALDRVDREPSLRGWLAVGGLLGLLLSVRWQSVVVVAIPLGLGLRDLVRGRVKPAWLLAAAALSLAAFSPQLLAWRVLYGDWVTLPNAGAGLRGGASWFDPSSPRAWDVLFSAQKGLFTWTPLTLLYSLALIVSARRWGFLGWAGLYLLVATTWLNGCLGDWHGSHAFGARRFDVTIPYLCLGLASLLRWLSARPLLLPVVTLALATVWNVGLARMSPPGAAPLEGVVAQQARTLEALATDAAGALGGPRGRALAYKLFVGEFFFGNINTSGRIDVAAEGAERYLSGPWSTPRNRNGPANFRWAIRPRSCVRFPLDWPSGTLSAGVTARAHPQLGSVEVGVTLNHQRIGLFELDRDWSDLEFVMDESVLVPGENLLCLEFSEGTPDEGFAAAVTRFQIGS